MNIGPNRRQFLRRSGLGAAGFALSGLSRGIAVKTSVRTSSSSFSTMRDGLISGPSVSPITPPPMSREWPRVAARSTISMCRRWSARHPVRPFLADAIPAGQKCLARMDRGRVASIRNTPPWVMCSSPPDIKQPCSGNGTSAISRTRAHGNRLVSGRDFEGAEVRRGRRKYSGDFHFGQRSVDVVWKPLR